MARFDRPGRPSKLTPEAAAIILKGIREGAPYRYACAYAGVSDSTFREWRRRAADDERQGIDSAYTAFEAEVRKAESEAILARMSIINKAAKGSENKPGDWKAAAWLLERRYPRYFGAVDRRSEEPEADAEPVTTSRTSAAAVRQAMNLAPAPAPTAPNAPEPPEPEEVAEAE
jgi:transposase-like protein